MKKQNISYIWMVTLILSLCSLDLLAQDETEEIEEKRRNRRHQMMEKRQGNRKMQRAHPGIPDLTETQKTAIKKIRLEAKKTSLPLKNELNEKQARLRTLSTAETVNMRDINKVADEIGKIKNSLMKQHLATHQKVRNLLTEEQRIHFDSKPMKRRGRHHGR